MLKDYRIALLEGDTITMGGKSRPVMTFSVAQGMVVFIDVEGGVLSRITMEPARTTADEGRTPEAAYLERNR